MQFITLLLICLHCTILRVDSEDHRWLDGLCASFPWTPQAWRYLVDPTSSHMLVSKIKPCMSKNECFHTVQSSLPCSEANLMTLQHRNVTTGYACSCLLGSFSDQPQVWGAKPSFVGGKLDNSALGWPTGAWLPLTGKSCWAPYTTSSWKRF